MRAAVLWTLPFLLTSCGDAPPGTVDEELSAFDLPACIAGQPACVRTGETSSVVAFSPSEGQALRLGPNATVEATLVQPFPGAKLAFVAVGLRAPGTDGWERQLEVAVDGKVLGVATSWVERFFRTDISGLGMTVPVGGKITLRATKGWLDVVYVVGRWNH